VAEFVLGHAPVQGEGCDQVDVIDAGLGGDVEHGLDDPLADVRRRIGGRGSETSSKAIVNFMSGRSRAGSGSESPMGFRRACRMAPSGSGRPSSGSGRVE
jgi:hypothetical protein